MPFRNRIVRISQLIVDLLRTADPPNRRWEITTSVGDTLQAFTGLNDEAAAGGVNVFSFSGVPHQAVLNLLAPLLSSNAIAPMLKLRNNAIGSTAAELHSGSPVATSDTVLTLLGNAATPVRLDVTGAAVGAQVPLQVNGGQIQALGDTGWLTPALIAGWVNAGGWATVGYRRINGVVYLKGTMINGTVGQAPFFLPPGYLPGADRQFWGASITYGRTHIRASDGAVYLDVGGNNAAWSLDGINYPAEA